MKTKQFIKEIKSMGFRVEDSESSIYIFDSNDYYVARVSKNGVGEVSTDFSGFTDLEYSIKLQLLNLLIEYAKTPIEEREEEKKYYYRLKGIDDGPRYLNYWSVDNVFNIQDTIQIDDCQTQFTDAEFEALPEDIKSHNWEKIKVECEEEC